MADPASVAPEPRLESSSAGWSIIGLDDEVISEIMGWAAWRGILATEHWAMSGADMVLL